MKCRTCLKEMDLNSSLHLITRKFILGKSIKEIILLFIPEMVKSMLVNDFICNECVDNVYRFMKFIERVIGVENYLKEIHDKGKPTQVRILPDTSKRKLEPGGSGERIKKQLKGEQTEQQGILSLGSTTLPTKQEQQLVLKPIAYTELLKTYSGNNSIPILLLKEGPPKDTVLTIVQSNTNLIATTVQTTSKTTQKSSVNSENVSNSKEFVKTKVLNSNREGNSNSSNILKNYLSSTPKDKSANTNLKANDLVQINQEPETEYLSLKQILNDTNLINTFNPFTISTGVNLNHNRVVSMTQTNEEVACLVDNFVMNKINLMKLESLQESENKRIIFLGNAFIHCPECNIRFTSYPPMKIHFSKIHNDCTYPITTEDQFCDIIRCSKPQKEPQKACPVCEKSFVTNKMLNDHISGAHKDYRRFICQNCGKKFKDKFIYTKHLKNYETYRDCKIRKCPVCKEIVTKDSYTAHIESHKIFKCDICKKKFLFAKSLNKHYLNHQKPVNTQKSVKRELCNICGKLLNSTNLKKHLKTHVSSRNHLCDKCPKAFKMKTTLQKHIKMVHDNTSCYECSICQGRTKSKEAMKFHMKLKHSDKYSFVCHICGNGFIREDYYIRHMNCHACNDNFQGGYRDHRRKIYTKKDESDPFYCCKYCPRKYKNVHLLRIHLLNTHLNGTPRFRCRYCDMTFKRQANQLKHEKRHEDPETFELTCQVCWNRFSDKETLEIHLLKHQGSNRHRCDMCQETFPSKYLMNHHKGEMHFSQELLEKRRVTLLEEGLNDFKIKKEVTVLKLT